MTARDREADHKASLTVRDVLPFDGVPGLAAVARGEDLTLLWCNSEFAGAFAKSPEDLRGSRFDTIFSTRLVDERMALLQAGAREGRPSDYYQLWRGRRCITRVWPLDPTEFGQRGWMIVMIPTALPHKGELPAVVAREPAPDLGDLAVLTRRELEVLRLICEGMSIRQVGRRLSRSERTIDNQIGSIHRKLGLHTRGDLVRFAVERGLAAFDFDTWSEIAARAASRPSRAAGNRVRGMA